jgi:uncharacterized protein (TIGR00297 family)
MADAVLPLTVAGGLTAMIWLTGAVSRSGALVGFAMTAAIIWSGGWAALSAWCLLVIGGSLVARLGFERKKALGVAQAERGRRGARHALANGGPGLAFLLLLGGPAAMVASVAGFGSALSDTVSGEIGALSRETPRLLLLGPRRPVGVDGAMTWFGTAAGLAAALVVALVAGPLGGLGGRGIGAMAAGAFAGNLADSLLGATLEPLMPRSIANEIVNALAGVAGGLVALLIWGEGIG